MEKEVKIEDEEEEVEVEEVEPYDDDRLLREISESLLFLLRSSKRQEWRARCFDHVGGTNEREFGEIVEKKLKDIFRLKKPAKKKKKKKPATDASNIKKEGDNEEEEWSDGSTDWSGVSAGEAEYSHTRSDYSNFEETEGEHEFESDTSTGTVMSSTFMRRMSRGTGWTAPPLYRAATPPPPRSIPPPSIPSLPDPLSHRPIINRRIEGGSDHGSPSKIPRLDMRQISQSTVNSDWNSDEMGRQSTPDPWSDREFMNPRTRPSSPMPSRSPQLSGRRILGELPLEKDEFDSDSDDEVPTRRVSFSHNHSPTTVSSPNSSPLHRPAWIGQDENTPLGTVCPSLHPSHSPTVFSPLTLNTLTPSASLIEQSNNIINVSSTHATTPSTHPILFPFEDDSHEDDPDFDSD